jgi:Methylamine utilisation protein MauE
VLRVVISLLLAAVLLAAVVTKLVNPRATREALATYGIRGNSSQSAVWLLLIAVETGLIAGVVLGSDLAAYLGAAVMLLFAGATGAALSQGKAGAPCACFGASSTLSHIGLLRNLVLAGLFVTLPALPDQALSTDDWLALGLGVALLACAGLAVAVLALAREVGMLRLRLGPSAALEVMAEGPEIGGHTDLIERFEVEEGVEWALAVFASVNCHVCRALEPAVESIRAEPEIAVLSFEEIADADVWESLAVPGAPYAVAIHRDGAVMAKGTFNNLAQLESILATADRRRGETLSA